MEELQAVLAVIREFASYTNPCHDCWYCQIRHLKLIFPWAAEEPLQFCPWRALVGVIWTELCSHNNHPRNGTFSCASHSCSKWNSDFRSLRNSHITHTWVIPRSPLMALFLSCPTIRLLKNLNSCLDCNINPQYNSDLLVCVLYSHMLPLRLHCDGWRFQGVTPQSRVLLLVRRVLVRSVFFWGTRCHTLVREAHPARSVALCSALSACCVEVMTAGVCANHLLAREDPCSTQTNKHADSLSFHSVLHLLEFSESHLHRFSPYSILLLCSDFSFHILFLKWGCPCLCVPIDYELPKPCSSVYWAEHQDHEGLVLLCHDASIAPSVCLLPGPKTICCKLYYGLFRLICCLQTRCDWVSIHGPRR